MSYTVSEKHSRRAQLGAASEMIAAVDLFSRGYDVFRALAASCPCDLIAMKNGNLIKIEVKTTSFNKNGSVILKPHHHSVHDHMALVVGKQVIYAPPLPE